MDSEEIVVGPHFASSDALIRGQEREPWIHDRSASSVSQDQPFHEVRQAFDGQHSAENQRKHHDDLFHEDLLSCRSFTSQDWQSHLRRVQDGDGITRCTAGSMNKQTLCQNGGPSHCGGEERRLGPLGADGGAELQSVEFGELFGQVVTAG